MGLISLTLPIAGQNITAGLHSTNYTALQNAINGGLDSNNWAAGKIFPLSQITQASAADGDVPVWDNSASIWKRSTDKALRIAALADYPADANKFLRGDGSWAAASSTVYRKTTSKAVTNAVTDTDLLNAEFQVAANALGTNKVARLTAWGDWIQNSGAGRDLPRFKVKLGATPTVVIDTNVTGGSTAASATRLSWRIAVEIMNLGAANSQWINFLLHLEANTMAGASANFYTTGEGLYSVVAGTQTVTSVGGNSAAIDTTAAMNVVLSVINANATATYETKLFGAILEVV